MSDINSLDDIFNSDTFGLLDTKVEEDIFTLKNVPKIEKITIIFASIGHNLNPL